MTFKQHYASFILFMYNDHIKEDWTEWKPSAKTLIYPLWFFKALFMWIISPLFIPEYFIKRSKWYKNITESYSGFLDNHLNTKELKISNKATTNNFLGKKYGSGKGINVVYRDKNAKK